MKNFTHLISLLFILSSCAIAKKTAPIEYHYGNQQVAKTPKTPFKPKPIIDETEGEIIDNTNITETNEIEIRQTETIKAIPDDAGIEDEIKIDDEDLIAPITSTAPVSTVTQTNIKEQVVYHEVQDGETIEDIAKKYNISVQDIATMNDLVPPYYLDEFQILKISAVKKTVIETKKIIDEDDDSNILDEEIKPLVKEKTAVVKPAVIAEFIPPLNGEIITKFGEKTDLGINKGISIAAKDGTKILASASGKVIYADYDATFGNLVIIKLNNKNIVTSYAHMQDIVLKKGDNIQQGDVVGYVGNSGKVKQPSLHFGIREGKIAKDPLNYIKF